MSVFTEPFDPTNLPAAGAPLLISHEYTWALWMSAGRVYAAPVLPNGLVAWSQAHTPLLSDLPESLRELADRLDDPDVLDTVFGSGPSRPSSKLPQSGRPLLVRHAEGIAFWLDGHVLMHCGWRDDAVVALGWANEAGPDSGVEPAVLAEIAATLHAAAPAAVSTELGLPAHWNQAREIVVTDTGSIAVRLRDTGPAAPALLLDTTTAPRLPGPTAEVWLDRPAARRLAAHAAAHPHRYPADDHATVRHAASPPTRTECRIWRAGPNFAVVHDPVHYPGLIGLRTTGDRIPLTVDSGVALAAALTAAAARADRVVAGLATVLALSEHGDLGGTVEAGRDHDRA
ncbi:hypothetical protein ALI22I_20465 [Saccharothrix sp. ALI-22-I]|uniref:hypothetical protein n=1 Tax=Saccharothrix sp. ALI-22-I TaxID=1933778 RepID=UPI00097BCB34|nr:hypothetical protein [Saccharothrix sp. ALI-22-I]ONI88115.1 hypothetical protein ALI22I_20465 [Saccharothrix sp. ALI-22-I]